MVRGLHYVPGMRLYCAEAKVDEIDMELGPWTPSHAGNLQMFCPKQATGPFSRPMSIKIVHRQHCHLMSHPVVLADHPIYSFGAADGHSSDIQVD